jgi:hypothetical protein
MADESPKVPWLPTKALGQILLWIVFCAMAAGMVLVTLTVVKC